MTDLRAKVPELVEPLFLAYSVTKTFTATVVLRLCEEGRLSLDDRLARWFPRIAQAARISLRRLLNHTAGIPDYGGLPAYHGRVRRSPSKPWSFERFAAETFEQGLRFEPGDGWAYSNAGYMLLKRIVEDVAGMIPGGSRTAWWHPPRRRSPGSSMVSFAASSCRSILSTR